ncbi:MAG: FUSC family protein [Hyphomicrobiales bacterium]|nr:FUSC family protein [Hyphomicrobiales bacterium]
MDVVAQSAELLRRPSPLGAEALRGKLRSAAPALRHGLRLSAAVSLALIVAFWLQLDNAYWAGTSASIVLQPALGASLRKGRFRAIGTVIGGIAILMLAAAFAQDRVGFLVCLTLWAAVCGYLATVLPNFAGYGAALAGITAVIVFAGIAQDPENVFQVTVRRITEIGIGIFAAGLVQSLSDFGDAARRLREAMTQVGRGIASGLSETLRAGAETAELRTSRRALIGAAIALDPLIDEAIGEPSHLRHQSGRLQAAFQALFVALSGWRGIGNHLDLTQQTRAAGSLAVLRRPIAQVADRDWLADPMGTRALCRTESRNVLQSAAPDPSSELLIECEARVLRSLAVVADALVVMSGAGGAPPVRITSRLRVPDQLPALVNALRVMLALFAAELIWIASPWPSGTFMIIFTAVTVLMATRQADAAYSHAVQITVGCVIAGLLAWLLDLAVLPLVHGGPFALSVALTLVFLPFGALSAGSWHKVVFVSAVTNLMPIVAIENCQAYDEARIFETTLAVGSGAVLAALFFRLLPPVSPQRRIERLLALALGDLRALVSGARSLKQESWLAILSARLGAMPKEASLEQEAVLLATLSVGEAAIALLAARPLCQEGDLLDRAFACLAQARIEEARGCLVRFAAAQGLAPLAHCSARIKAAGEATLIADALQRHAGFFAKAA